MKNLAIAWENRCARFMGAAHPSPLAYAPMYWAV